LLLRAGLVARRLTARLLPRGLLARGIACRVRRTRIVRAFHDRALRLGGGLGLGLVGWLGILTDVDRHLGSRCRS
jgi:hypothetical protein